MQWTYLLQRLAPALGALALGGAAVCLGVLLSVSWLVSRARFMADEREVGSLALALCRRRAAPAGIVSALAALAWLGGAGPDALRRPTVASLAVAGVALVVVHLTVGARARRTARSLSP